MSWFEPLFSSMAVAVPVDVKVGAVESTVRVSAADFAEVLPAESVAAAVMA